jgi:O-antigen/teichoic acid export membrane protein
VRQPDDETVKQVRGSALLLSGRGLSRLLNGAAQILLARALTQSEYGAFAYGLAVVSFGQFLTTLGLTRVITRQVPVYEERREYGKAVGTIVLVFGTIVSFGLTLVLLVNLFSGSIEQLLISDRRAVALLSILIALTPIEALNQMSDGILAVLGRPGAIFIRKHVLAPVLRIAVVSLLIWQDASLSVLAVGYVGIGVVGLAAYAGMLVRAIRDHGFPIGEGWRRIQIPFREIQALLLPIWTAGLLSAALEASDVFILGRLDGTAEVAGIRAVQPLARLVQTFQLSFTLLFTTLAARLYARDDHSSLNDAYWRTACWVTLLSFPIFATTFVFSGEVTATVYGPKYADSASILAILSLGYFVHGSLGLNEQVLFVFRRMSYLVAVNVTALIATVAAMLLLVPAYGAIGAAVAKAGGIILINVLLQAGLRRGTGVRFFDTRFAPVYLAMTGSLLGLWALQSVLAPPLWAALALTGVVWLVLVFATRRTLQIGSVFPEIKKIPLARYLAGEPEEE